MSDLEKKYVDDVCRLAIRRIQESADVARNTLVSEHAEVAVKALEAVIASDWTMATNILQEDHNFFAERERNG